MKVFKVTIENQKGRVFAEQFIAKTRNALDAMLTEICAGEPEFVPATITVEVIAEDAPFRPQRDQRPRWLTDDAQWAALRQRLARDWADPDLRKLMRACLVAGGEA